MDCNEGQRSAHSVKVETMSKLNIRTAYDEPCLSVHTYTLSRLSLL